VVTAVILSLGLILRLHSVPRVELGQHVPDVGLDGALLDDEPFGDLGIRQAHPYR
jgi:hypothetical protein